MAKCIFFLIFSIVCLLSDVLPKKLGRRRGKEGKIVGGTDTTINDYPYQAYVLVERNGSFFQCGGSIISTRYILTAAHCLVGVTAVYVRVGSTNSDSGGSLYYTPLYRMHSRYNAATSDYDIAYVDLARNIRLNNVTTRAVKLTESNTSVEPNTEIVVTGWGDTTENGNTSNTLMAVKIPTVSNEECRKSYNTITARMFCAGEPEGGKDSCQGDSGGPAVSVNDGIQIGVVSFGLGCARPNIPGVYTNISAVRSWIRSHTGV